LQQAIEELNLAFSETVAFGDDFSDIEMLKACGIGVAVDNAIVEVKDAADYIRFQ
jgi:hydroxymethylpyrimidine pyrophosphatase-like HAD family hydrolase